MTRVLGSLLLGAGVMLGLCANACTTEAPSGTTMGACTMVIEACHPKDDGTNDEINGCHSRAHDGDDAVCSVDLQECLDTCNAAPDVGGTGEHETDHGTGHETDHGTGHETGHETEHGDDSSGGTTGGEGPGSTSQGSTSGSTGVDDASEANCEELGSLCHDTDDKLGMMCHDVGHDGDEAACAEIWVECVEHCT